MDKAGVQDSMISGQPVIKMWGSTDSKRPIYYLDNDSPVYPYALTDIIVANAVKSLPPDIQKRFHPFICGFNPLDKNAVYQIEMLLKWYPHFWQGIGQINTRHGELSRLSGDIVTADNPALYPVYDLAAKYHLPVIIQSNITTTWVPMDSADATTPLYLNEILDAVKSHPKTIFIWAHAGLDRNLNIANLPAIIGQALSQYPNLYIDISGLAYPYLFAQGKPLSAWVDLIKKYPNRFIFGTDAFTNFDNYSSHVAAYKSLFDALPVDVAIKVFKSNFIGLLPQY